MAAAAAAAPVAADAAVGIGMSLRFRAVNPPNLWQDMEDGRNIKHEDFTSISLMDGYGSNEQSRTGFIPFDQISGCRTVTNEANKVEDYIEGFNESTQWLCRGQGEVGEAPHENGGATAENIRRFGAFDRRHDRGDSKSGRGFFHWTCFPAIMTSNEMNPAGQRYTQANALTYIVFYSSFEPGLLEITHNQKCIWADISVPSPTPGVRGQNIHVDTRYIGDVNAQASIYAAIAEALPVNNSYIWMVPYVNADTFEAQFNRVREWRLHGASMGLAFYAAMMGFSSVMYTGYLRTIVPQSVSGTDRGASEKNWNFVPEESKEYVLSRGHSTWNPAVTNGLAQIQRHFDLVETVSQIGYKMTYAMEYNFPLIMPPETDMGYPIQKLTRRPDFIAAHLDFRIPKIFVLMTDIMRAINILKFGSPVAMAVTATEAGILAAHMSQCARGWNNMQRQRPIVQQFDSTLNSWSNHILMKRKITADASRARSAARKEGNWQEYFGPQIKREAAQMEKSQQFIERVRSGIGARVAKQEADRAEKRSRMETLRKEPDKEKRKLINDARRRVVKAKRAELYERHPARRAFDGGIAEVSSATGIPGAINQYKRREQKTKIGIARTQALAEAVARMIRAKGPLSSAQRKQLKEQLQSRFDASEDQAEQAIVIAEDSARSNTPIPAVTGGDDDEAEQVPVMVLNPENSVHVGRDGDDDGVDPNFPGLSEGERNRREALLRTFESKPQHVKQKGAKAAQSGAKGNTAASSGKKQ